MKSENGGTENGMKRTLIYCKSRRCLQNKQIIFEDFDRQFAKSGALIFYSATSELRLFCSVCQTKAPIWFPSDSALSDDLTTIQAARFARKTLEELAESENSAPLSKSQISKQDRKNFQKKNKLR
jgi:hypothetical protein